MHATLTTTGLVVSEAYTEHLTGQGHREQPGRVTAIVERLKADGLFGKAKEITPRPACHSHKRNGLLPLQ